MVPSQREIQIVVDDAADDESSCQFYVMNCDVVSGVLIFLSF